MSSEVPGDNAKLGKDPVMVSQQQGWLITSKREKVPDCLCGKKLER